MSITSKSEGPGSYPRAFCFGHPTYHSAGGSSSAGLLVPTLGSLGAMT